MIKSKNFIKKNVDWDFETNTVKSIILKEAGISAKIGLGDNRIVPYEKIEAIGEYRGVGIGLAVVKRIIDWHGGHIWVE